MSHFRPINNFVKINFLPEQEQQTGPQGNNPQLQQHPQRKSRNRRRRAHHTNDQNDKPSSKRVINRQENRH